MPTACRHLDFSSRFAQGRFFSEIRPYYYGFATALDKELWSFITQKRDMAKTVQRMYEILWFHKQKKKYSEKMNAALSYLEEHFNQPLELPGVAAAVFLSPNYLNRLFKMETGFTCMDYLIRLRVRRAQDLLNNTDFHINEIAQQVGYDDPYYFSRIFKQKTGIAPKKYRKQ